MKTSGARLKAEAIFGVAISLCLGLAWIQPAAAVGNQAEQVYGQGGSFTTGGSNTTASTQNYSAGIALDSVHHRLFVTTKGSNRIVEYNLDANNNYIDDTADFVLGQPNFTSYLSGSTQNTLSNPIGLSYDGVNDRLFVADNVNNRVLAYDTSVLSNGENASYVIGQPNFTSTTAAATQAGLNSPAGVDYDSINNRLFVADWGADRVMVYNLNSIANGMNASFVIGQTGFVGYGTALNAMGLVNENGLSYDPGSNYLYVADSGHNRVLVFNLAAIANGMNATYVLGQSSFTTSTATTSQSGMNSPTSVDARSGTIFVSEQNNNRVLAFNKSSLATGMNASYVYGQADFTTSTATTTQYGLNRPFQIVFDTTTGLLYVADFANHRTIAYRLSANANSTTSVTVDPAFTFVVTGKTSICNGESNFLSVGGNSSSVALGHIGTSSNVSAGQALTVSSNAGGGFAVYIRGSQATQNLRNSGHNWLDVTGTYAVPAALGSIEAFGYTYKDSTASTSVTNPGSALFAALDATNRAVMGSATSSVGSSCISFDAQTSAVTPAGTYSAAVIYTAVPTF